MGGRQVRVRPLELGGVTLVFAQIGTNLSQALMIGFTMSPIAELIIQQAFDPPPG